MMEMLTGAGLVTFGYLVCYFTHDRRRHDLVELVTRAIDEGYTHAVRAFREGVKISYSKTFNVPPGMVDATDLADVGYCNEEETNDLPH